MHASILSRRSAALAAAVLVTAGCATAQRQQRPGAGSVTIGVTTTGAAAENLTFRLTIEPAGITGTVKADAGVFTKDDVPPGEHVVRLGALPSGCTVDGGAERKISISRERPNAILRFDVRCA